MLTEEESKALFKKMSMPGRGGGAKKYTREQYKVAVEHYFASVDKHNEEKDPKDPIKPYSYEGLAAHLGLQVKHHNKSYRDSLMYKDIFDSATARIQAHIVENALTNQYNATFSIFLLKNYGEHTDRREVHNTNDNKIVIESRVVGKDDEIIDVKERTISALPKNH